MSVTREDIEDLFAPCARVSVRRMFGGHGIYADGLMVAIETGGAVYMKADAETKGAFETAGSAAFSYEVRGRTQRLGFFRLPESAWEDPEDLEFWFILARNAAERAAQTKARPRKPTKVRG